MENTGRLPILVNLTTGERFTINDSKVALGRAPDNQVVLPEDGYASAYHAQIYWDDGAWWVEDLNSSNGTKVNDQLLNAAWRLAPSDVIRVGRTEFRIE
ncbi:MAG: FHA domain-containing protein [Cyanobacteria bacterium HKST-UBA02]|nr:FHA domain-containing protein [Cyanobacteria bacterium HKST-UBA02]